MIMTWERLLTIYFSPTGGTKTAALTLSEALGGILGLPLEEIDFTLPETRQQAYSFDENDLVVCASPVYAGRLPNKIMPDWRECLIGGGATAVPVVVYGNRSYGGALMEFRRILEENEFRLAGAAAVVGRHAFTDALAAGRPDEEDKAELRSFAGQVAAKLTDPAGFTPLVLDPDEEIPPYYTPLREDGEPAKFLKAVPETDETKCDRCGICREICPMGSIDETMRTTGVCIKCQACVRRCPKGAKYFTDENFLSHVRMLEANYTARAANYFQNETPQDPFFSETNMAQLMKSEEQIHKSQVVTKTIEELEKPERK